MSSLETPDPFTELLSRVERAERVAESARRQVRVTWAVSALTCVGAFTLGLSPESRAQFGVTLTSLNTRLTAAEAKVAAVQTKTASMSAITDPNTDQPTVRFSGVNVQVVNGTGNTTTANATGNLIVGYNETGNGNGDDRTGSHNLVVGSRNSYSAAATGGAVFGQDSTIAGQHATVTGGYSNTASGFSASVSGGLYNSASEQFASVSGGGLNMASGNTCSVTGGFGNTALGDYTVRCPAP